jgi:hypothetical protein
MQWRPSDMPLTFQNEANGQEYVTVCVNAVAGTNTSD